MTRGPVQRPGLVQETFPTHFLEVFWVSRWCLKTLRPVFSMVLGVSVNVTVPLDGPLIHLLLEPEHASGLRMFPVDVVLPWC